MNTQSPEGGEKEHVDNTDHTAHAANNHSHGENSSLLGPLLLIIGLIVLVAVGIFALGGGGGPVATVNGESVDRASFNNRLDRINEQLNASPQSQNVTEDRKRAAALQSLVDELLLVQAAENAGITVSDSEVQAQLDSAPTSTFATALGENAPESEKREYVRRQLLVQRYVENQANGSLEPTEQEIEDLYNQYSAQLQQTPTSAGTSTPSVPELSQLRPQLEAAVRQRKQQELATQLLNQARESAEVDVLIDGVSYPPESVQPQTQPATQATSNRPVTSTEDDAVASTSVEETSTATPQATTTE